MGIYEELGIQDGMSDAELATHLSAQRTFWESKAAGLHPQVKKTAQQHLRQLETLSHAEAGLGNFPCPALVMKTLCAVMEHRYSDYHGFEEGLVRSCSQFSFRGEFRSAMAVLRQLEENALVQEWRDTLESLGAEFSMPREKAAVSPERAGEQEGPAESRTRENPDRKSPVRSGGPKRSNRRGDVTGDIRRRLRRALRRLKRRIRRGVAQLSNGKIPVRLIGAAAGILAAIIVVIVLAVNISSARKAAAEQKAQEEAAAAASEEAAAQEEAAKAAQEAILTALQGMDNYQLTTDTSYTEGLTKVTPADCTASSVLVGSSGKTYGTEYLFDEDLETSWQEGEEGDGLGVTLTASFAEKTNVKAIAFWNGNETSQERYEANNRLQGITITVDCDGQTHSADYALEDTMGEQVLVFDTAIPADSLAIRINSVYNGTIYQDTVLSEMAFFQ